jgi:hypothetical protein
VIGGAFYRKFDRRHPGMLWFESVARFLTRHGSFFGDQSIFVRREIFRALGGFAPIALMEDLEFSRRLRRHGQVAVLDPPVESSGRRHLERGPWRTTLENGLLICFIDAVARRPGSTAGTIATVCLCLTEPVLTPSPLEELGPR